MDDRSLGKEEVISTLKNARKKDLPLKRVLSSMCTPPHPIAVEAHKKFIETNLGDKDLFPGTKEIERMAVQMMGDLVGRPGAYGYITTGGTEANIQAIRTARNISGRRVGNIIVPESAHFSFDKIADVLQMELRKAPLDEKFRVRTDKVEGMIDEETIALVGIAGTTEHGQIDPIPDLGELALDHNLFLHVDAAFGGFVIPFMENGRKFGFEIEGVDSISMDPHKMGLGTIPAGGLLFRRESHLKALSVSTPYLTTKNQISLVGTRSGASAAAAYAVMKFLGREGYRKIVRRCTDLTKKLAEDMDAINVRPLIHPVMNVLTLDLDGKLMMRLLWKKGWITSTTWSGALRLVIMPHHSEDILDEFVEDFEESIRKARNISES